ncbi:MAG: T9SS type A sorting domain-containing protein, partial [Bacteroidetes bacterium]|nr:T9SS type A sorting domain-containing protein [Bacteroidota bacterium]
YFLTGTTTGWAVGGQDWSMLPVIAHTTDGINWVKQTHPISDGNFYEIHMVNDLHGWAVGNHILHTQNGGTTWTEQAQDYPNTWKAVFAVNENLAFAVGNDKRILKYDLWEGMDENGFEFSINVYPNPAFDHIIINTGTPENEEVLVSIYETSGKKVLSESLIPAEGFCNLNLQGLNEGLYILNVRVGFNDTSVRLMLMRP